MKLLCSFVLACVAICTGLPASSKDLPVLRASAKEVLYRVSETHEPFVVECIVDGSKTAKYTWQKNGNSFSLTDTEIVQRRDEGSLVFLKPKPSDAGDYQCFATTELGTASSSIIRVRHAYIKSQEVKVKTIKAVEGRPLKLDCSIPDAYPKPEITWRYTSVNDPKISTEVSDARMTYSPEGTMYITSIDKSDASKGFKFVCQARTPASDEDVVLAEYLIEEVQPNDKQTNEIEEMYTSKDMTVKFGDRTYIYCIFGGIPQAYQDWSKDGVDVGGRPGDRVTQYNRSKGKRLLIRDTWLEDAGTYKCVSSNKVGKPLEHSMTLTVVAAPQPKTMPSSTTGVSPGNDLTIPCSSAGWPAPKLTWSYNSQPITTNDHIVITQSNQGNVTTADLTIKNAKTTDKGYYGCKAENEHGVLYGEVAVNVA